MPVRHREVDSAKVDDGAEQLVRCSRSHEKMLVSLNRYLRTGTRRVQKRKTATIKANYNPEYHAKLKYNACNVMGK